MNSLQFCLSKTFSICFSAQIKLDFFTNPFVMFKKVSLVNPSWFFFHLLESAWIVLCVPLVCFLVLTVADTPGSTKIWHSPFFVLFFFFPEHGCTFRKVWPSWRGQFSLYQKFIRERKVPLVFCGLSQKKLMCSSFSAGQKAVGIVGSYLVHALHKACNIPFLVFFF